MDRYAEQINRAQRLALQMVNLGYIVDILPHSLNFRVNTFAGWLSVACVTNMLCETYIMDSPYQNELGYGWGPRNHNSLEALEAEIERIETVDLRAIDKERRNNN
jgi:hypothetical protein